MLAGSMALNRMDAAKGAAISLLAQAYKNRNKICLINFHGKTAEVVVPPTKSIAMTKNRLESMPCGGGSPLAHALEMASKTGLNSIKIKKDVGRCILVLITDGRANIPLCISHGDEFDPDIYPSFDGMPTREFLHDEVISSARILGSFQDFDVVVIDTEDKFISTGLAKVTVRNHVRPRAEPPRSSTFSFIVTQETAEAAFAKYYRIDVRDVSSLQSVTKRLV